MGYYFNLVFDHGSRLDCEAVIEKFRRAGAKRVPDEDIGPAAERFVDLLYPQFGYPITVRRKEPENSKGNWASIRISWAENPETMLNLLGDILELADAVGCRVSDGQIKEYVNRETLENIKTAHAKTAGLVMGLIGRARQT